MRPCSLAGSKLQELEGAAPSTPPFTEVLNIWGSDQSSGERPSIFHFLVYFMWKDFAIDILRKYCFLIPVLI